MGTYDEVRVGDVTSTEEVPVEADRVERMIRDAGYTHPIFTDEDGPGRAGFAARPVPGQLVLALLAGMAEQADLVDDTVVALVAMDAITFRRPITAGARLRLVTEVLERKPSGNRGLVRYRWTGEADGQAAVDAEVVFLFATSAFSDATA